MITRDVLEEAERLIWVLRNIPEMPRAMLLHMASDERHEGLSRVKHIVESLMNEAPEHLVILGLDREHMRAVVEAIDALAGVSARAASLLRALSAGGIRLRDAEQQIERALYGSGAGKDGEGGSGWWEAKHIRVKGREYGPYLYWRWREGGRKRSKYEGKG